MTPLQDRLTSARFPFGEPLKIVEQKDHNPKKVFVIGVYASAVHARWIGPDGATLVSALAVASEPYIFWRGEDADAIIKRIRVPAEAGRLVPAAAQHNGPSGQVLDNLYLAPLGLTREDVWLCDMVPHSCCNDGQDQAIRRAYNPIADRLGLPPASIPPVPAAYTDEARRAAILSELRESQATVLVLLGDQPIKWFLRFFCGKWQRLSDFGESLDSYGRLHGVCMDGLHLSVLPLVHPRQAGKLGLSSPKWKVLHDQWVRARNALNDSP